MASDVDALCERIRQLPSARDPASVGRAALDVRAALEARGRRIEELEEALLRIQRWDMLNPPDPGLLHDLPWLKRLVDQALGPDYIAAPVKP